MNLIHRIRCDEATRDFVTVTRKGAFRIGSPKMNGATSSEMKRTRSVGTTITIHIAKRGGEHGSARLVRLSSRHLLRWIEAARAGRHAPNAEWRREKEFH